MRRLLILVLLLSASVLHAMESEIKILGTLPTGRQHYSPLTGPQELVTLDGEKQKLAPNNSQATTSNLNDATRAKALCNYVKTHKWQIVERGSTCACGCGCGIGTWTLLSFFCL